MFNLRNFLMTGFRDAVGKMEDYQIILNATGWYEKNVLLEEDLAELQRLIEEKNTPVEETENEEDVYTEEETEEVQEEIEPVEEVLEDSTEEILEDTEETQEVEE